MTTTEPLDPDQVPCRRCGSPAGEVCRQPDGSVARSIHVARRRDAAGGGDPVPDAKPKRTPRPGKSNLTDEARRKGAQKSAQERRRRKAELSAQVEARRAAAEQAAIDAEAQALAEDAARYAKDRAVLRRLTLTNAVKVSTRLEEHLDALKRVPVDEGGRVETIPVEHRTKDGIPYVVETADVRGWASVEDVERLAKAAAQTLNSVRLEEGKPTGIEEQRGGAAADRLGDVGVADLIEYARRTLSDEDR